VPTPTVNASFGTFLMSLSKKRELATIQKRTVVKRSPKTAANLTSEEVKEIENLEKQAVKMTLADIKAEDPQLYDTIKKKHTKTVDADQINSTVVKKLFDKAPKLKKPLKPGEADLEELGDDAYERYFNLED